MTPSMVFEIQKIIGVSTDSTSNVRNFQVQWAPCWVSSYHLAGCEKLIEEFLGEQQKILSEKQKKENGKENPVEDGSCMGGSTDICLPIKEDVSGEDFNQVPDDASTLVCNTISSENTDVIDNNLPESSNYSTEGNFVSLQYENNIETSPHLPQGDDGDSSLEPIKIEVAENVNLDINGSPIDDVEISLGLTGTETVVPSSFSLSTTLRGYLNEGHTSNSSGQTVQAASSLTDTSSDRNNISMMTEDYGYNPVDTNILVNKFGIIDKITPQNENHVITSRALQDYQYVHYNHIKEIRQRMNGNFSTSSSSSQVLQPCNGKAAHTCQICGKQFHNSSNKNKHMRSTHFGETRYECDICGKKSFFKQAFFRHMRKHTGERPYECGGCDKQFTHKQYFKKHPCTNKILKNS